MNLSAVSSHGKKSYSAMSTLYRTSRAAASTVCQKCLRKGHYSYECKEPVQARPYTARPSRSQQLLDPRLRAQLSNAVPDAPPLSAKGLADKILAEKAEQRKDRKRSLDGRVDELRTKRARSTAYDKNNDGRGRSSSSSSVETISTNRSRPPSLPPARQRGAKGNPDHARNKPVNRKRRRSASTHSSSSDGEALPERIDERNIRSRKRSASPQQRGRRKERHMSPTTANAPDDEPTYSQGLSRRVESMQGPNQGHRTGGYEHDRKRERKEPDRDGEPRSIPGRREGGGSDGLDRRQLSPYSQRKAMAR